MSDRIINFEDLSAEEQKAIIERGRAQYAPLRTPSVVEQTAEANAVPPAKNLDALYRAGAKAATNALTGVLNPAVHFATEPLVRMARVAQEGSLKPLTDKESPVESARPLTASIARLAVPQTPLEAGILVGAAGGGLLARGARPAMQATARVAGSGLGGAVGNYLQGDSPLWGSALGTGSGLIGEGLGYGVGKLRRSLPGAKTRIAGDDAAALGAELSRQSPPLAGATTAAELADLAAGGGRKALGAAKEAGTQGIEAAMGPQTLISVPSLSTEPMTFREANRRLSEIGARAFSKNPLDRTILGVDQRKLYGEAMQEMVQELRTVPGGGPELASAFAAVQSDYKKGINLLKRTVERKDAWRPGPNGLELNTPALQRAMMDPKTRTDLTNKLGPQGFNDLVSTLTRGGELGMVDQLTAGQGRFGEALRQLGMMRNTGAGNLATAPFLALTPNLGSQYVGRLPYAPSAPAQTLIDLLAQRASFNTQRAPE